MLKRNKLPAAAEDLFPFFALCVSMVVVLAVKVLIKFLEV